MGHYQLGKLAAKQDKRTLKLKSFLGPLPPIPDSYVFPGTGIPTPVFANDQYGDCVIAGRAHQTLRFEFIEQQKIISVNDADVVDQYFAETGGIDSGLIVLESLKKWRKEGWRVGGSKFFSWRWGGRVYDIYAFAALNYTDRAEVKAGIYLLTGIGAGLRLPISAYAQFEGGQAWSRVSGATGEKGTWGGHYVYIDGYSPQGLTGITWGRRQWMSWDFFQAYCDEAYAIVDNRDRWLGDRSPINIDQLNGYLEKITAGQ